MERGGSTPLCLPLLVPAVIPLALRHEGSPAAALGDRSEGPAFRFCLAGCPILLALTKEGSELCEGWGFSF